MAHTAPTTVGPSPTVIPRVLTVDVVIPVHNEQDALADCVTRLRQETTGLPYAVQIVVADNASSDRTPVIGRALADRFDDVTYRRLEQKGRGRALHTVWSESDADLCAYMDVDLSTDLAALAPAIAALASGHFDLSIGTRLSRSARVAPAAPHRSGCRHGASARHAHDRQPRCDRRPVRAAALLGLPPGSQRGSGRGVRRCVVEIGFSSSATRGEDRTNPMSPRWLSMLTVQCS